MREPLPSSSSSSLEAAATYQQTQQQLSAAIEAANDLLISSLAVGEQPTADDAELDAQIAAYRASISSLTAHLGPDAAADAAQLSSSPRGRDQGAGGGGSAHADAAAAAAAAGGGGQAGDGAGSMMVPGLGREGVDYTVGSADDLDPSEWQVPPHCIPIHANVTTFDWSQLCAAASFDVVMIDPPWQLATANPTRGVALGYSQLTDNDIRNLPIPQLQSPGGFLFVWVINSKYQFTLDLFDKWGYTLVDEVVWVKMTVNRRVFKSHGYYLQHAKEVCMVARKNPPTSQNLQQQQQQQQQQPQGQDPQQQQVPWQQRVREQHVGRQAQFPTTDARWASGSSNGSNGDGSDSSGGSSGGNWRPGDFAGVGSDIIFSERRGQSQKPEEIYELIESLVPNGKYLEIFARKNNLRNFWVSIGNEVTGTGLPEGDMQAFKQTSAIPGAVYGRAATTAPRQQQQQQRQGTEADADMVAAQQQ